jgi:FAD synthetase
MVFGTFDVLHPGHLNFFNQARKLAKNPYLIVSVARDVNVKSIKGKKPLHSEKARLQLVKRLPPVDKAVLGGVASPFPHILKERPAVIALGYDQSSYVDNLAEALSKKGLKVRIYRLKPYKKAVYKSSLMKKNP